MSKPAELAITTRRPKRTGKRGGQKGNTNALKHGVWANIARRNLDGRTALAKELQAAENSLIDAIGGKPTPQQRLLIGRVVYKSFRCGIFETASINGDGDDHSAASDAYYLAWANSLRQDLQALGLEGLPEQNSQEGQPLIKVVMVPSNNRERNEPSKTDSSSVEEPEPDEQHPSNSGAVIRVQMVPTKPQQEPSEPPAGELPAPETDDELDASEYLVEDPEAEQCRTAQPARATTWRPGQWGVS